MNEKLFEALNSEKTVNEIVLDKADWRKLLKTEEHKIVPDMSVQKIVLKDPDLVDDIDFPRIIAAKYPEAHEYEIVSDEYYWTMNGIVFSGEQNVSLVLCPPGRSGIFRIPEGIRFIGTYAFYKTKIIGISFPDTVQHINDGAFYECNNLTKVDLPISLKYIGDQNWENPFEKCKNLISVDVDERNEYFYSDDGLLYEATGCLLCCPAGKIGEITLPEDCVSVGQCAFSGSQATAITLPCNLHAIASYAFADCQKITSISIPKSVETVYDKLFYGCTSLKDIYWHADVDPNNGKYFLGCPKDLCIHGKAGGYAERYAKENSFQFYTLMDGE